MDKSWGEDMSKEIKEAGGVDKFAAQAKFPFFVDADGYVYPVIICERVR